MNSGSEEGLLEKLANQDRMLKLARAGNPNFKEETLMEQREKTIDRIKERRNNKAGEQE